MVWSEMTFRHTRTLAEISSGDADQFIIVIQFNAPIIPAPIHCFKDRLKKQLFIAMKLLLDHKNAIDCK